MLCSFEIAHICANFSKEDVYKRQGKQWALNKLNGLDLEGKKSLYRQQYIKWLPLYESDILISPFCCDKQKEEDVYKRQGL